MQIGLSEYPAVDADSFLACYAQGWTASGGWGSYYRILGHSGKNNDQSESEIRSKVLSSSLVSVQLGSVNPESSSRTQYDVRLTEAMRAPNSHLAYCWYEYRCALTMTHGTYYRGTYQYPLLYENMQHKGTTSPCLGEGIFRRTLGCSIKER